MVWMTCIVHTHVAFSRILMGHGASGLLKCASTSQYIRTIVVVVVVVVVVVAKVLTLVPTTFLGVVSSKH